jgi:hypothetical protein
MKNQNLQTKKLRDQVGDLATFLPINTGPLNTLKEEG